MGVPFKINDGNGNPVSVDMKLQADRMKKIIREDNNPIELNHKIKYE